MDNSNARQQNYQIFEMELLARFPIDLNDAACDPKEKFRTLFKIGNERNMSPVKMFMHFNDPWVILLDEQMKEIKRIPGSLITQPTAFISKDPLEKCNNVLVFTITDETLSNPEMHFFQVLNATALQLVKNLIKLRDKQAITLNNNNNSTSRMDCNVNQNGYGDLMEAKGSQEYEQENEKLAKSIFLLNHCFDDIEKFLIRLQSVGESSRQVESIKDANKSLMAVKSMYLPMPKEFQDILAKHKLAFNYIVKLGDHFQNPLKSVHNLFLSLETVVHLCNSMYGRQHIPENVVDPLLTIDTVTYLKAHLGQAEIKFWHSLGLNWIQAKEYFTDHKGQFTPIFFDGWTPDWVVDEIVPSYIPHPIKSTKLSAENQMVWLTNLRAKNANIAEVLYNKLANNHKELNVCRGEYLEVIQNTQNWWKCRNSIGHIGYVPHTILSLYNFESTGSIETSRSPSLIHNEEYRDYQMQSVSRRSSMARSASMPNVPVPPPMPPIIATPNGTLKREKIYRNAELDNDVASLKTSIHDELKLTLQLRERRKDLEILITPDIYINQYSSSKQVEDWLKAKGFSDTVITRLKGVNGQELFALTPQQLESYFDRKESRRLISQILLQKNICEYKTIRSSEFSAKLAKARQKVDENRDGTNEVF